MRKDVKRRKIPTKAKTRQWFLEAYEHCYGCASTWGMWQVFSIRLSKKYLKAKRLSKLRKDKKEEGNGNVT